MKRILNTDPIPNLPTVGIIGGGQLALMLVRAASQLGLHARVIDASPICPARRDAADFCEGNPESPATLDRFAMNLEVVTLENEFLDAALIAGLEAEGQEVLPSSRTMSLVQDKLAQKQTLRNAAVSVVDFEPVNDGTPIQELESLFGLPFVLKKRCHGYDGTGNFTVHRAEEWDAALNKLGGRESGLYAERWCPFERELAVIVTRSKKGEHVLYPVVETRQRNHVCEQVIAPAAVSGSIAEQAAHLALKAIEAVDGVGSFGVEFFLLADGTLLVNEIAPRVHNSGHYTIEACECSQFENHIRAICGLPLGSTKLRQPAAMVNLLGKTTAAGAPRGLAEALAVSGAHVHLYGKHHAKRGRKMGHVTALGSTSDEALATAQCAADFIHFDQPNLI
ncbi:5-(carboxyamino)imidazole ribonucleotide synthase [Verrucomicrobium spinosum]|uniref:5-(carboxyamino)imidazole ribonucleotide synthase n=1 Tax=Verrucomicrobium spinosum TaxID=2736 RepID=UPI00017465A6|nr:5-(carboxyamino)imidazole ribonucleotide synthase [Verrucomicrobium spinosum]